MIHRAGIAALAGLLPLSLVLALLSMQSAQADDSDIARPARIAAAQAADITETHEFPARTEAVQVVDLSFRVPGQLQSLPVREGELVKQGTLIARLDPADYERKVREAEVNLTSARQDFERKQQLVGQNAVSRQAFDDARNALDLAEVALEQARQNLEYTSLTAPFDAIVSRRLLDSFTNVQAGQAVARLQDVSEIRVAADIPEYLIARDSQKDGIEAVAVFPFLADRTFDLTFREISTEANNVAQTYRVSFGMPRPEDVNILPGMTATLRAQGPARNSPEGTVIVPPSALVSVSPDTEGPNDTRFFVWVVTGEDGAVSRRPVSVARMTNSEAFVSVGLTPGDRVVTAGVHHLRDGMRVRPLEQE
ncbi:efflux RND transporter periplasmic adaptor subunit [Rhodospira trueperi]|uniref:RND family efflux transporter, MFP subunit n=1 Tax=Rhodospira trueperi TaxID=69960 RepID=A0A1G6X273_9PROT|nr:efflux RND transporter periplasmic adaptor subunit [Rhodospira trueperi]SDD71386.1 RND family efflux transporter, MFP subunit [Rhodospira trueperi]